MVWKLFMYVWLARDASRRGGNRKFGGGMQVGLRFRILDEHLHPGICPPVTTLFSDGNGGIFIGLKFQVWLNICTRYMPPLHPGICPPVTTLFSGGNVGLCMGLKFKVWLNICTRYMPPLHPGVCPMVTTPFSAGNGGDMNGAASSGSG